MSHLLDHAKRELELLGYSANLIDALDNRVRDCILELVQTFATQNHSGSTAPYVMDIFTLLASFKPLTPLTGEDDEWVDVSIETNGTPLWQNKRASYVFKRRRWSCIYD